MTQKELKQYIDLSEKFEEECNRVCDIITNSKMRHGECKDIRYAERFHLVDNSVEWEGDEYWNYGGHEWHSGCFPSNFLTMSDEEIHKIVEKENEEWEAAQERRNKEKAAEEKAKRMAQYEELKKEFENE